ncbi:hypothetical protein RhiJN_23767 [Ceratobasidium sp. AG-Ba]|nr:hypothetical protein RhiJN_23767 [Ceratobasidium sp. AG-Ba]
MHNPSVVVVPDVSGWISTRHAISRLQASRIHTQVVNSYSQGPRRRSLAKLEYGNDSTRVFDNVSLPSERDLRPRALEPYPLMIQTAISVHG